MNLLANILIKPVVLLLVALLLTVLARRSSASLRSALLTAAILSAAILPVASSDVPQWNLTWLTAPRTIESQPGATSSATPPARAGWTAQADSHARPNKHQAAAMAGFTWDPQSALLMLWMCGFIFFTGRLFLGIRAAQRIHRSARPAGTVGRGNVEMRIVEDPCPPMTWGIFRSTILMPAASEGWTAVQRELVIAHELAHVERCDALMQLVTRFACAMYWFNPLMWIAARQLQRERERACDDRVLATGASATEYAEHLLDVARTIIARRHIAAAAVWMAQPSQLETRLRAILDCQLRRNRTSRRSLAILSVMFAAITILISSLHVTAETWTLPPLPFAPRAPELERVVAPQGATKSRQTNADSDSRALAAWAESEVRYIISPAEKHSYEALTSDGERERFVSQFWAVRNPQPGSPANAYKDEYYRRVEYANSHFACSLPGWQSDRGRTYITYGKPDEIETSPSGGSKVVPTAIGPFSARNSFPAETWIYHSQSAANGDVVYNFVDRSQDGQFALDDLGKGQSVATLFTRNINAAPVYRTVSSSQEVHTMSKNDPTGTWESASGTQYELRLNGASITVKLSQKAMGPFGSYDVTLVNDANEVNTYRGAGSFTAGSCGFTTKWELTLVSTNQILGSTSNIVRTPGTCNVISQADPPDAMAARLDLKRK